MSKRLLAFGVALAVPLTFSSPSTLATTGPAVESLSHPGSLSYYAFVEYDVTARARPSAAARRIGRLANTTYWGTSTVIPVLERTVDSAGRDWSEVRLPQPPPNRLIGWVPSEALSSLHPVHTWLQIDREHFTATLIRNRRVAFRARVGVGQLQWPTPTGNFVIEERIMPTERRGAYGSLAFGTSAHSKVLTEWPNRGQIGIHGTNEPWLIPGNISHGCIRLRNPDIRRLDRLMPVGTPVTIR